MVRCTLSDSDTNIVYEITDFSILETEGKSQDRNLIRIRTTATPQEFIFLPHVFLRSVRCLSLSL